MYKYYWACAILAIGSFSATYAGYPHVCSRTYQTSYQEPVYRTRVVSYINHHWWHGNQVRYKDQSYWDREQKWKINIEHFCCFGYQGSTNNCQPICLNGCPGNRFCSAPEVCSCNSGYGGDDCQPVCENCGKHEYCQEPGKCSCNAGYKRINESGDCLPECSKGCGEHSFCSEPEICQCEVGYDISRDPDVCSPVCESPCGEYSSCKEPNLCTCNEGYKNAGNGQCQPVCETECMEHSQCTGPNKCECLEGYELVVNNTMVICQPICEFGCPDHSTCTGPNSCDCHSGYIKRGEICHPECPNKCQDYAQCVAPNVCECFPGYEELIDNHKCQPKCTEGCPSHAICTNPDACRCEIGYLMSPNNTCEPQCSRHCLNGICTEPETCACLEGYQFRENSQDICDPICTSDCINGDCLGPDFCVCHIGYKPNDSNSCTPSCEMECINGNCTSPDQCTCLEGFEISDIPNHCKPKCSEKCNNGECIAPDLCQCSSGYVSAAQGCELETTSELTTLYIEPITDTSTTLVSESTTMDTPPSCHGDCQCFAEQDELETGKCLKSCLDDHDKPCLNLTRCNCALADNSLICEGDEDHIGIEPKKVKYVCKIPMPIGKSLKIDSQTKSTTSYWLPILGILVGIIVISGVLGAIIYRKREIPLPTDPIYDDVL